MARAIDIISFGLVVLFALGGCSEDSKEDREGRREEYGPVEFEATGAYSAYVVRTPVAKPEQLASKTQSPTGLGGKVEVPRCHRWGVCVYVNFGLEGLTQEMAESGCPEVLVYDWDSGGGRYSDEDLLGFARVSSLRRLDLQLCKGLSTEVLNEICRQENLEQLLLPASGEIDNDTVESLRGAHPLLDIVIGPQPTGQTVGKRIDMAISAGR